MSQSLSQNESFKRWAPPLAIAILTFLVLFPSLRGVYIWDDDQWLTANQTVQEPRGLVDMWVHPSYNPQYYPLVFTTFWLEYRLWGNGTVGEDGVLRGLGYHFDNLLLHIGTALAIFYVLKKLKLPGGLLGAWLAAAIFAVHPINVESVAWVAERKNVLCGFFFFTALFCALRFFDVFEDSHKTSLNWLFYAAALGLFLLAMFSKTVACALPPTILLMIWYRRGKIRAPEILLTLPFFVIGGALAYVTTLSEHGKAGTRGPDWMFSPLARTLIAGQDLWFYIGKIFAPFPVMQIYPRFSYDISNPLLYVAPIAFLILIILLFLARKQIGRGPIVAILFFFGSLLPVLGFINFYTMIYTFVADHYQYLSCIAIIVLAVESILWLLRMASLRAEDAKRFYTLTTSLFAGGVLLCLGLLSFFVANLYTSAQALWQWNTDMNPAAFAAWNNLAEAFQNHKPISQQDANDAQKLAFDAYRHSIQVAPQDWRAYENIGVMYLGAGMIEPSLRFLNEAEDRMPVSNQEQRAEFFDHQAKTAQRVQDTNRQNQLAFSVYGPEFHIAKYLEDHEKIADAIDYFKKDLARFPTNTSSLVELGICYLQLGNFPQAQIWCRKATEARPNDAQAWFNLAMSLRQSFPEEGRAALIKAQTLDPEVILHLSESPGNSPAQPPAK